MLGLFNTGKITAVLWDCTEKHPKKKSSFVVNIATNRTGTDLSPVCLNSWHTHKAHEKAAWAVCAKTLQLHLTHARCYFPLCNSPKKARMLLMLFQVLQETWDLHKWLAFFFFPFCLLLLYRFRYVPARLTVTALLEVTKCKQPRARTHLRTCIKEKKEMHWKGFSGWMPPIKSSHLLSSGETEELKSLAARPLHSSERESCQLQASLAFVCLSVCFSPSITLFGSVAASFSFPAHFFLIALYFKTIMLSVNKEDKAHRSWLYLWKKCPYLTFNLM